MSSMSKHKLLFINSDTVYVFIREKDSRIDVKNYLFTLQ